MFAEAITIISGFALLGVFALVGWNLRHDRARDEQKDRESPSHDSRRGGSHG